MIPRKKNINKKTTQENISLEETVYFNPVGFEEEEQTVASALEPDIEILIDELLIKVTNYWKKQKIVCEELTREQVSNFCSVNGCHRCSFQCPFCIKKIPCTRKKYWEVGNLQSHLKTHIVTTVPNDSENNPPQKLNQNSEQSTSPESTDVHHLSNQQNLNVNQALEDVN